MKAPFDTILFDLDGTLTDSQEGIINCIRYALKAYGIEETDMTVLHSFIGPPLEESFALRYGFDRETTLAAVDKYRERFSDIGIFENRVYPGAVETLRRLHGAGYTLALATSKPRVYAERICEHFGMSPFLRQICGPELDGTRNDKGEVIAYTLDRLNADRKRTVMVGDRRHDILGALQNGITPWGVLYGYGSRQELEEAGAERLICDFDELCSLFL